MGRKSDAAADGKIRVIARATIHAGPGEPFKPGEALDLPADEAAHLRARGLVSLPDDPEPLGSGQPGAAPADGPKVTLLPVAPVEAPLEEPAEDPVEEE